MSGKLLRMAESHIVTLNFATKEALDNWIGWYLDGNGEQDFFASTDQHHPIDLPEDEKCFEEHDPVKEAYAKQWYPSVGWTKT